MAEAEIIAAFIRGESRLLAHSIATRRQSPFPGHARGQKFCDTNAPRSVKLIP
jgi:hypothetical protein